MNEPQRFLSGGGDAFEADLLRSAKDDGPAPGAKLRTLAALGIATTAAGTVAATAGATAASSGGKAALATGVAGTAAAGAKAGLVATMGKWIVLGALGGGLVAGGASLASSPEPAAPLASPAVFAASAAVASDSPALKSASPTEAPATTAPVEVASPESGSRPLPTNRPAEAPPEAKGDPLAEELAALDRVREALGAGSPGRALTALDAHDRQFPKGPLGPEALMLRIEALAAAGRPGEAARLGDDYLAAHPTGPYARRVRTLLGREAEGGGAAGP